MPSKTFVIIGRSFYTRPQRGLRTQNRDLPGHRMLCLYRRTVSPMEVTLSASEVETNRIHKAGESFLVFSWDYSYHRVRISMYVALSNHSKTCLTSFNARNGLEHS